MMTAFLFLQPTTFQFEKQKEYFSPLRSADFFESRLKDQHMLALTTSFFGIDRGKKGFVSFFCQESDLLFQDLFLMGGDFLLNLRKDASKQYFHKMVISMLLCLLENRFT